MMHSITFLAVDLGSSHGRILAIHWQEGRIKLEPVHYFETGPTVLGGHLYWDVLKLWAEIKNGLQMSVKKFGRQVVSIGIDAWGVDFALLDRDDELIANPYHYRDPRTVGMIEEVTQRIPQKEIYCRTGIQFMRINTLYQLMAMRFQNSPQLCIAQTLLMIPDLFNFWLCGEKACEFIEATTTQFCDPSSRNWVYDLLERLNIPTHILQPIIPPGTVLGTLRLSLAQEVGARHPINVITPPSHDTASAVAAIPFGSPDSAFISSGTWSLVGMERPQPIINPMSLALNFTNEGGFPNCFLLMQNLTGLWLLQECRRHWANKDQTTSYPQLLNQASAAIPFKCLIDPDDERFIAPRSVPEAIRSFCRETSQPMPKTEGEYTRCCLESLALKYRWAIEQLEMLTGTKVDTVHIVGGGTQNDLLNQFTSNAIGKLVLAGSLEATGLGNALVQAMTLGYLDSTKELRSAISRSFSSNSFEPDGRGLWEDAYGRFCRIVTRY